MKHRFQALRVRSSVIFRSSGTDESFHNTCGKDLRFYRHCASSFDSTKLEHFYHYSGFFVSSLEKVLSKSQGFSSGYFSPRIFQTLCSF